MHLFTVRPGAKARLVPEEAPAPNKAHGAVCAVPEQPWEFASEALAVDPVRLHNARLYQQQRRWSDYEVAQYVGFAPGWAIRAAEQGYVTFRACPGWLLLAPATAVETR